MKHLIFTSILLIFFLIPKMDTYAQNMEYGKVTVISNPSAGTKFSVGDKVRLNLNVQYKDLPKNSDLYILLLPSHNGQVVMDGGKYSLKGLKSEFCGGFKPAKTSKFKFAEDNYPVTGKVPFEADMLMKLLTTSDVDELSADKMDKKLTFAFVTSFGDGGSGIAQGSLEFVLPHSDDYYDELLVRPYIFQYQKDEKRCASFNANNINELTFAVKSDIPPPPPKEKAEKLPPSVGELSINSYKPANARLRKGSPNLIEVQISYKDLEPESEIYVTLNTMKGEGYLRKDGLLFSAPSMSFTAIENPDIKGGFYKISAKNKPIYCTGFPVLGPMESAYVATIKEGGSGTVTAKIKFTPPPMGLRYTGIKISPLYFKWRTYKGEYKHIGWYNSKTMEHVIIPLQGAY